MSTTSLPIVAETHEWEVPSYKLDAFKARIAQANKRLARAGLDARFDVVYEDFDVKSISPAAVTVGDHEPVYVYEPWVRATLTGPLTLRHGHFAFVARLVPEEAGITVHSAPGQELRGYSPRGDSACEHCKVERSRSRVYLVRDERDGTIIQLGHSCIELYTGVSPKGLWSLTFDEELDSLTRNDEGGFGPRHYGAGVETVLAYAFAHSEKGRAYIPAGMYSEVSTVSKVRTSLFFDINRLKEPDRSYYVGKGVEAAGHLADTELMAAIKAAVVETAEDSDYGRNLRVLLAGESVTGRNVGVLGSLVKVYARQQQLEAERKAHPIVAGFLGEVGARIKHISATAKTVSYQDGNWGTTTFLVAITDDGHTLVWKAHRVLEIETGQRFTIGAATIKAHEEYKGTDQTVITRASRFEACTTQSGQR